jgi:microcystin-dependent protein
MAIVLDGTTGINTPAINAGNIVGEVCFFGMSTAPAGFLKANGAAVSRTTYADLFAAIGTTYGTGDGSTTFNLPDMRGEFPRGWDDGRGVDSGRAIGAAQLDQMQRITGGFTALTFFSGSPSGALTSAVSAANVLGTGSTANRSLSSADSPDARVSSTTAGETRSRNVALLACIKF